MYFATILDYFSMATDTLLYKWKLKASLHAEADT